MASRMERYVFDESDETRKSRTRRNQELYQDLGNTSKYTTMSDIPKIEAVSLDDIKRNKTKREGYRLIKDYDFLDDQKEVKRELEEFKFLYPEDENKNYDLNMVLKEAKKLREKDELERKRKLHNEEYNILESSEDELKRFKEEQDIKRKPVENEEKLEELINTITSKELREKIDDEKPSSLLSDLMATSNLDDVVKPVTEELKNTSSRPSRVSLNTTNNKLDKSFYTKSMDLSIEDLDTYEEEKTPFIIIFLRLIFSILLIGTVGFIIYYIIMNF